MSGTTVDKDNAPIPQIIHFIWAGTKHIRFMDDTVVHNKEQNPNCKCILWLDAFSMSPAAIKAKTPADLYNKYDTWSQLLRKQSEDKNANKVIPAQDNIVDPQNFTKVTTMLYTIRKRFCDTYLGSQKDLAGLINDSEPLDYMIQFAHKNGIEVRFLDQEYLKWYNTDSSIKQYFGKTPIEANIPSFLCQWTWIELYRQDPNFGSWGDLVRVQLLADYGGMYCDHDDKMQCMHAPDPKKYQGYKAALTPGKGPTTSFQAGPPGHSVFQTYQARMRDEYANLLKNGYRWEHNDLDKKLYWQWTMPSALKDERDVSPYYQFTINATGPAKLNLVVIDLDAITSGWKEPRVVSGTGHAWLGEGRQDNTVSNVPVKTTPVVFIK